MQCVTYVVSMSPFHYHGRDYVSAMRVNVCTSLTPRSITVVFGLGMRQCVHMRTRLENGILRNGQQPQSVVNGFC